MWLSILLMLFFNQIKADFYTTASGMRYLLETEDIFAKAFLDYYDTQTKILDKLEEFINTCESDYILDQSREMTEAYVGHPSNSWKTIKRFVNFWMKPDQYFLDQASLQQVGELITNVTYFTKFDNTGFGNSYEIKGAVFALIKVQETYKLPARQFMNGVGRISHKLNPDDLFSIGRYGMQLNYYELAREWLELALDYFSADYAKYGHKLELLYQHLSWCSYLSGDIVGALDYTDKELLINPASKRGQNNLVEYKRMLLLSETDQSILPNPRLYTKKWMKRHDKLCRHEEEIPNRIKKTLFCEYSTPHPQFYIKPLKMETIYHDPKITVYHEFLSENEIDHFKKEARKKLEIARVYSMTDGRETTANYRISKNAWMDNISDTITQNIRRRVGALTNLDMNYSEDLQVANYGIGGNYEPHYDFASPPNNASVFGYYGQFGNRIATVLMYLTDVEKGGDTVFTQTGKGVMTSPIKGSAALWYNLKRNGKGDFRTRHAGCPIFLGEKWIANYWIHEYGQEFRRPCLLNKND